MADINSQPPALRPARSVRKALQTAAQPAAAAAAKPAGKPSGEPGAGENTPQTKQPDTTQPGTAQADRSADQPGTMFEETAAQLEMVTVAELLFFAYREFTADADAILLEFGFGRAHHRVLHFVTRSPGLRIADLLQILKITKQSLARVLRQLLDEDIISQRAGSHDRRERLLYATEKGAALTAKLAALQSQRIETALQGAGPDANNTVKRFLFDMIKRADQQVLQSLLNRSGETNIGGNDNNLAGSDAPGQTEEQWEEG